MEKLTQAGTEALGTSRCHREPQPEQLPRRHQPSACALAQHRLAPGTGPVVPTPDQGTDSGAGQEQSQAPKPTGFTPQHLSQVESIFKSQVKAPPALLHRSRDGGVRTAGSTKL